MTSKSILTNQLEVHSDIFTTDALRSATLTLPAEQRKTRWDRIDVDFKTPATIVLMRNTLLNALPFLKINTSIIKRYSPEDGSLAYQLHRDPDEFMDAPLVLITLSGESLLTVVVDEERMEIQCNEGTTVILKDPTLKHMATPPKNTSGIREFLFFGHSNKSID
jgi:hypothetical protein